jgi:hypothetical protein
MFKRFHPDISSRFEELRDLCTEADDKASLAVGMAGMTVEHVLHGRVQDASTLASETMALVESIGDPALTIALSFAGIVAKHETGETVDALRWTQAVIDLTARDFDKGRLIFESPRATALAWRGVARFRTGAPGFHEDFGEALAIAEQSDTLSKSTIITYKYAGIPRGVFLADDTVLREIEAALKSVERSSDDMALFLLRLTFAIALIYHGADRSRGYELMRSLRETSIKERFAMNMLPVAETYLARERAEQGEEDLAIGQWRSLAEEMDRAGHYNNIDIPLIYTAQQLMSRGDYDEAACEIERLMSLAADHQWASREIAALQLRAELALARGDETAYRELRDRYRAMANGLGFEGHMKWAAGLP